MTADEKKQVPVRAGLWSPPSSPDEKPQLIGSRCPACGEVFFPKRERGICIHCQHRGLEDCKLSPRGKIHSFSVIMQQPTQFFVGKVPYAYGVRYLPHEELCWLLHDDAKAVYFTSWAQLAILQTPMLAVNANPPLPFGEKDLSASRTPAANQ